MARLSEEQRLKIIELRAGGCTYRKVAHEVHCTAAHARRVWLKYQKHKTVKDLPKPKRAKKLGEEQVRRLAAPVLRGQYEHATDLQRDLFPDVSVHTVRRALRSQGLRPRCKVPKPLLTPAHRRKRVKWAREHRQWTVTDWHDVWFSDEAAFVRVNTRGRQIVWVRPGSGLTPRQIKPTVQHGGGHVSVFAIVSNQGLVTWTFIEEHLTGQGYKQLLRDQLLPSINRYWPQGGDGQLCFMQDNASTHTALIAQEYLDSLADRKDFRILDWPAHSPDLNPLENVWAALKRHLKKFPLPPTLGALRELMLREVPIFNVENQALFANLYESLPKRMELVIKSKGYPIRY